MADTELIPGLVSMWEFDDDEVLSHSTVLQKNKINSLKQSADKENQDIMQASTNTLKHRHQIPLKKRHELEFLKSKWKKTLRPLRRRHQIKLRHAAEDKEEPEGSWITSNGHHIFIPDGKDKGEIVKNHFEQFDNFGGMTEKGPRTKESEITNEVAVTNLAKSDGLTIHDNYGLNKKYIQFANGKEFNKFVRENTDYAYRNFKPVDGYSKLIAKPDQNIGLDKYKDDGTGSISNDTYEEFKDLKQKITTRAHDLKVEKIDKDIAILREKKDKSDKIGTKLSKSGYTGVIQSTSTKNIIISMEHANKKFDSDDMDKLASGISQKLRPPSGMSEPEFKDGIIAVLKGPSEHNKNMSFVDYARAKKMEVMKEGSKHFYDIGDADRFRIMAIYEGMPIGQVHELVDDLPDNKS